MAKYAIRVIEKLARTVIVEMKKERSILILMILRNMN